MWIEYPYGILDIRPLGKKLLSIMSKSGARYNIKKNVTKSTTGF